MKLGVSKDEVIKWIEENDWFLGPWEANALEMAIEGLKDYRSGEYVRGWIDGHIHLDRVFTYKGKFFPPGINLSEISDLPLEAKQDLVGYLHDGYAYSVESLRERMSKQINRAVKIGTRQIWAPVDTTADIGTRAFDIALELKDQYREEIDLKIASYPLFGFKNPKENSDRLDIFKQASKRADFLVGLPEKDEGEDRIGFKGHVSIMLDTGYNLGKEVHLHADQKNSAWQEDSFKIIQCLEALLPERFSWFTASGRPRLWLVHVISPSGYSGKRFSRLLKYLVKYNIGVICCPTAAISMRQLRSEQQPTHNSIARIIEMLRAGVQVVFGTDNVNDYLVPSGNGLILREIAEASNYLRSYPIHILVKLGIGISLSDGDKAILSKSLHEAKKIYSSHKNWADKKEEQEIFFEY